MLPSARACLPVPPDRPTDRHPHRRPYPSARPPSCAWSTRPTARTRYTVLHTHYAVPHRDAALVRAAARLLALLCCASCARVDVHARHPSLHRGCASMRPTTDRVRARTATHPPPHPLAASTWPATVVLRFEHLSPDSPRPPRYTTVAQRMQIMRQAWEDVFKHYVHRTVQVDTQAAFPSRRELVASMSPTTLTAERYAEINRPDQS